MKKITLKTAVIIMLSACFVGYVYISVFGAKRYYPDDGDRYLQQELRKYRNSDRFTAPVKFAIARGRRYFTPEVLTHTISRSGDTLTLENDMCTLTLRTKRGKIKWSVNVPASESDCHIDDKVVRSFEVQNNVILVCFGKHGGSRSDILYETGRIHYFGRD